MCGGDGKTYRNWCEIECYDVADALHCGKCDAKMSYTGNAIGNSKKYEFKEYPTCAEIMEILEGRKMNCYCIRTISLLFELRLDT